MSVVPPQNWGGFPSSVWRHSNGFAECIRYIVRALYIKKCMMSYGLLLRISTVEIKNGSNKYV